MFYIGQRPKYTRTKVGAFAQLENGRTSRLLMNYIQAYHGQPMSIVYHEDRQEYIESLIATRKDENIQIFLSFMENQHLTFLKEEIKKLEQAPKKEAKKNIRLLF
jgi:hypothetical protein